MLQVRHVVRHGKGFIVFALTRRCLPVHGADLLGSPRSLNINSSSSSRSEAGANLSAMNNTDASGSLGDGEVLKTRKAPKSNLDSRGGNHSSRSDSKDGPEPGKSLRETAKDLISQFTKGTKVLWVDFKASRQASARKKAGEALTFQEDRQLRQVGRDLAKALPVLTVFSLPIAGYLAPAIGFIFPKTLLPPQFWSSPQRLHFMLEDATKQEVTLFPKLLQHLGMLKASPRPNSSPQQLRLSAEWFWREGSLERLTKAHLTRLLKACNTVPPFKKMTARFAPKSSLVGWLRNEASSISNDDLALRKEFYSRRRSRISGQKEEGSKTQLTPAEVLVLCWERGLLRSQHRPDFQLRRKSLGGSDDGGATAVDETIPEEQAKAMLCSLEEYLALYDTPSLYDAPREIGHLRVSTSSSGHDGDVPAGADPVASDHVFTSSGAGPALPPSMLLHAPALLRITRSTGGPVTPLCHLRVQKTGG